MRARWLWWTVRSWFRSRDSTPDPRPVEDWSDYPSVRNGHGREPVEDNKDGRTP